MAKKDEAPQGVPMDLRSLKENARILFEVKAALAGLASVGASFAGQKRISVVSDVAKQAAEKAVGNTAGAAAQAAATAAGKAIPLSAAAAQQLAKGGEGSTSWMWGKMEAMFGKTSKTFGGGAAGAAQTAGAAAGIGLATRLFGDKIDILGNKLADIVDRISNNKGVGRVMGLRNISEMANLGVGAASGNPIDMVELILTKFKDVLTGGFEVIKGAPAAIASRYGAVLTAPFRAVGNMFQAAGRMATETHGHMKEASKHIQNAVMEGTGGGGARPVQDFGTITGSLMKAFASLEEIIPLIGKPLSGFSKFEAGLLEGIGKLKDWNQSLHNANIEFASFSAGMARVKALQTVREVFMERERGNRRAGGAEALAEASMGLQKEVTAPVEDVWANLENRGTSMMDNFITKIGEYFGVRKTFDRINQYIDFAMGSKVDTKNTSSLAAWATDAGRRNWAAKYGKPARFESGAP